MGWNQIHKNVNRFHFEIGIGSTKMLTGSILKTGTKILKLESNPNKC